MSMSKQEFRRKKLIIALNDWFDNAAYYDDDTQEVVIRDTEQDCYDCIMQDKELHLLGERFVKDMIHIMFTNWNRFSFITFMYKAN